VAPASSDEQRSSLADSVRHGLCFDHGPIGITNPSATRAVAETERQALEVPPMLILLLVLAQSYLPESHIPAAERQVLLDFYRSTQGDGWTKKDGWGGPEGTECDWFGITCFPTELDWRKSNVNMIKLPQNNLKGALPESLATLPSLFSLEVSGNAISTPLPEALLRRWDAGFLDIDTGGPLTSVEEIRLALLTSVYCTNETIIFRADDSVSYYRERCRRPHSRNPRPYCELRRAKTRDFERLYRFLLANGFFDPHEPPWGASAGEIDGGTTIISVRGPTGIRTRYIGAEAVDALGVWSYEKVLRGAAQDLRWLPAEVVKQCPWNSPGNAGVDSWTK
jgi:hypothetical protein